MTTKLTREQLRKRANLLADLVYWTAKAAEVANMITYTQKRIDELTALDDAAAPQSAAPEAVASAIVVNDSPIEGAFLAAKGALAPAPTAVRLRVGELKAGDVVYHRGWEENIKVLRINKARGGKFASSAPSGIASISVEIVSTGEKDKLDCINYYPDLSAAR